MKTLKLYFVLFSTAGLLATTSCSSTTQSDNKHVTQMDSVSRDLDKSNEALVAETKKVEASLEKIDKELPSTK